MTNPRSVRRSATPCFILALLATAAGCVGQAVDIDRRPVDPMAGADASGPGPGDGGTPSDGATPKGEPPPVPTRLTICAGSSEAFLHVGAAPDATGVNVYVSTTAGGAKPGGTATKISAKSAGRIGLPLLTPGTKYFVAAAAVLGATESALTRELAVTPKSFAPVANILFGSRYDNASVDIWDNYLALADGAAPSRSLVGASTGIDRPAYGGIAASKGTGELYVSNQNATVTVFGAVATISGDTAPARTLSGPMTTLAVPRGLALDTARNILYVANRAGNILRFDDACNLDGNTAPSAVITGASTKLGPNLTQIAIDEASDRLFVANYNDVLVFDQASTKNGDVPPAKQLAMGNVTIGKQGIGYDAVNDALYVASLDETMSGFTGAVFGLDMPSALTSGTVTPTRKTVNADTAKAATVFLWGGRLFLLNDSGRYVQRWNDAKSLGLAAPVRTQNLQAQGAFYTGIFFVP